MKRNQGSALCRCINEIQQRQEMAQAQQAEQQLIDQQMAEAEELQIMLENDINAAEKQQQTAKRQADASSNSGSSSLIMHG